MEAIVAALPEYFFVVMRIHELVEICQVLQWGLLLTFLTQHIIPQMAIPGPRPQQFAFHHA